MEKILVENINPSLLMSSLPTDAHVHQRGDWYNRLTPEMESFLPCKNDVSISGGGKLNILGINTGEKSSPTITPLYHPFKLPIRYINPSEVFTLSKTVSDDLELLETSEEHSTSMYERIFQPSNPFAKQLLPEWGSQYTTNIDFLKDTQNVLREIPIEPLHTLDCSNIMSIWKDLKENPNFMEKYNFVEWSMLKNLNESPLFLQIFSMCNLLSPIMSLLIPLLFLLVPFIILKLQKKNITFDVYIDVLKNVAKHHFIGKTISSMQSFSIEKLFYICFTFAFYVMQVYQNTILCSRFYQNIQLINQKLIDIAKYTKSTIHLMNKFIELHSTKKTYVGFCKDVRLHSIRLQELHTQIDCIEEFKYNPKTLGNIGYILKCYYVLHSNIEFEESLRYSIGFVGYIDNLRGIFDNIQNGHLVFAEFNTTKSVNFKDQYHPSLKDNKDVVKNNCKLNKNMIITGSNASGKTTFIKTTAINIIFTQQLGVGFYKSCNMNPYEHIHSYINIPDTSERDSLFQAESRRCKTIIDSINDNIDARHFCIFDELYSGTNPIEACKASYSFLVYLSKRKNVSFILTTHLKNVCKKMHRIRNKNNQSIIQNCKMDVIEYPEFLEYTYKIKKGITKIDGAIHILREMNYPKEILETFRNYNK